MSITKEQVIEAQNKWANGIVNIGKAYIEKAEYTEMAKEHIESLYAYDQSTVLFKPTKAAKNQYRGDKETALSYFVASNNACEEDKGFAIQPWTKVRFENEGIIIQGDTAIAMGNYFFTDINGQEVKVEYTFGYLKDEKGTLKINVHHSSIPYSV